MTCPVCKRENIGRSLNCAFCGAALPIQAPDVNPPEPAAPAKRPKISKIAKIAVPIIAAVLLATVLIAIISARSGSADYIFVEQDVDFYVNNTGNQYTVFVNGEAVGETVGNYLFNDLSTPDNRVSIFHAINNAQNTYYLLDGKDFSEPENSDKWTSVALSASGNKIAYTVFDEEKVEATLYLYDIQNKTAAPIDTGVNISGLELSPDGESLTYIVWELRSDSIVSSSVSVGWAAYFFDGKKSVKLGENIRPIALSNGGKYIYVTTQDKTVVLIDNRGRRIREFGEITGSRIYFNADFTQMLYIDNGMTYISADGGEGVPFFKDGEAQLILPENTKMSDHDTDTYFEICPVYSFYDLYYSVYNSYDDYFEIYQIGRDPDKAVLLADEIVYSYAIQISEDGERIYYPDRYHNLNMIQTKWGADAPDKALTLAERILPGAEFVVSADGSRVYYLNIYRKLCSVTGDGEERKEIISNVYKFALGKGDILFINIDENGDLCYCSDGSSVLRVNQIRYGAYFRRIGYLGYCYIQSGDELYCTDGSASPKKVLQTKAEYYYLPDDIFYD